MTRRFGAVAITLLALALPPMAGSIARAGPLTPARKFDRARAAHLLRRAGFGGTSREIDALWKMGLKDAVNHLVDYDRIAQPDPAFHAFKFSDPRALHKALNRMSPEDRQATQQKIRTVRQVELANLRAWWLRRMARSPRPFEEKMTLFWHGHFTTGAQEVQSVNLIANQNALLREHATAPFGELLAAVCHDPAMLKYLDNASNRREHPNENLARELLELFTLGTGNYTEHDIREAARALTGWTFDRNGFTFRKKWHDGGTKTFLGETGRLDGDDIIAIILQQEALPKHLAKRLLVFFVRDDPPSALVKALAARLRDNDLNIRETMRALLMSESFYSPPARFTHIKSPAELVACALRSLDLHGADYHGLASVLRGMGQELFQPPNVKGWDGGRAWITASTLQARHGFVRHLLAGTPNAVFKRRSKRAEEAAQMRQELVKLMSGESADAPTASRIPSRRQPPFDSTAPFGATAAPRVGQIVDYFIDALLQRSLAPEQRLQLMKPLGAENNILDMNSPHAPNAVGALIRAIMTLPEYQLS